MAWGGSFGDAWWNSNAINNTATSWVSSEAAD
jgi:hypothetical protein